MSGGRGRRLTLIDESVESVDDDVWFQSRVVIDVSVESVDVFVEPRDD